jgi:LPS-assembly protein
MSMLRHSLFLGLARPTVLACTALFGAPAIAAEPDLWRYCGSSPVAVPTLPSGEPAAGEMQFIADHARVEGSHYRLQGRVIGGRGDQQLSAERLDYNADTDTAQARGEVRYQRGERIVTGETATLHLGDDSGHISPARFWFTDRHLRGQAEIMNLDGPTVTRLRGVRFTTCDEGDNAWQLKAARLRLDSAANEGIAHHARLEFMHVPIFYFPYLSFPLAGRKSGFLAPSIGETSVAGTEISLPFYWNIAPHRDATITPRNMTRRGVLLETEFRYLNPRSRGQLDVSHLSNDRVYGDDRAAMTFHHLGAPAPGWRTRVDYRYASDADYLDDFGSSLSTTSVTHLERRADLDYRTDTWEAGLRLQGYQTLDESLSVSSRPYQRLPQLRLALTDWRGPAGLTLGASAETVRFERAEGVVGTRFDLQPHISWPLRGAPGFLVPKFTLRHTRYQLDNIDPTTDTRPSRTLPLFSLDGGLIFERDVQLGRAQQQTLEPRLFYLHVPHREQSDLIVDENGNSKVFDSGLPRFGFNQLFRDNRFSGADRVGDAKQLSAALSTRLLDSQGRELASANLGRIYYFRDREVALPGAATATDNASDWVAELKSQWTSALRARASLQWDTRDHELTRGSASLRYMKDRRRVLRLGYRFERETLKQVDVALIWPLATHWNLVGRRLRSLHDQVTLETLKGVEYQSCCWAVSLVQRRYRVDADEELSDSIWFQLELKGLTSVGRKVENLLARDILAP